MGAMTLVDKGADVNARDEDQNTPLHNACICGYMTVALALLDRGADIHARDKNQNTPIHWACNRVDIQFAMALADRGANVHDKMHINGHVYILHHTRVM